MIQDLLSKLFVTCGESRNRREREDHFYRHPGLRERVGHRYDRAGDPEAHAPWTFDARSPRLAKTRHSGSRYVKDQIIGDESGDSVDRIHWFRWGYGLTFASARHEIALLLTPKFGKSQFPLSSAKSGSDLVGPILDIQI